MVGRGPLLHRYRLGADHCHLGRARCGPGGRPRLRRRAKQVAHLRIGRLGEIPVGIPDGKKRRRRRRADHFPGQRSELLAGGLRCRRHGHHDPGGRQLAQRLDRGAHARTRRKTVIDDDHCLARHLGERPALPVGLFPAQELAALLLRHLLDDLGRNAQTADHVVVDHHHPAAGDRPHRQLLPTRHSQLADEEDVKRGTQSGGHLIRHRHPATREPQHHDIGATPILLQEAGQESASIPAIAEEAVWHDLRPIPAEGSFGGLVRRARSAVGSFPYPFRGGRTTVIRATHGVHARAPIQARSGGSGPRGRAGRRRPGPRRGAPADAAAQTRSPGLAG